MSEHRPLPASIEVVPKQINAADDLETWFPSGTRVYLPDVGVDPLDVLVDSAVKLREHGYEPVPHFPARRMKDRAELELRLNRLSGEAGATDILIIGGGLEKEAGEFASTMDVLDTGLIDNYGIRHIGVAGHPEGSPDFTDEVAMEALKFKQDFQNRTDTALTIVTQFGFDAERFVQWAEGLAANGIDLPVHLGVTGPAKLTTLVKFAVMCGVGPSLQFLKKRAAAVTTLVSGFDPEIVAGPIDAHCAKTPNSAIKQLHVFPFGGAKKASAWLVDRGSW
ncbi:MAG: methylenetetrahydrofolate reductase [Pseudomonadota bacterium]